MDVQPTAPAERRGSRPLAIARPSGSEAPRRVSMSEQHDGTTPRSSMYRERVKNNDSPLHQRQTFRDVLDAQMVLKSQADMDAAPWYILRPASRVMSAWDGLTATALIFTATVTPFEVAFLETAESTNDALFVINRLLDVIFTLDMLAQFFLMYKIGEEGASVRYEYRLPLLARNYLRGWFALDLFSIAPSTFDILPFVPGSGFAAGDGTTNLRVFRVIRTTRLLKLVRLVRSSRLVTRWRTRISVTFATLTIVTLSFAIMVLTHWLACILALQTIFSATPSDSWMGATGWCAPGDYGEDDVCAPPAQLW